MAKRKKTDLVEDYQITVSSPQEVQAKAVTRLRCIYDSTLIISGDKTVTGNRYRFEPDQIQSVDPLDYDLLLSLEQTAGGCCGGGPARTRKYFEGVE